MDDVLAVMDAVGSERAVLFGPSEGGPMAALFAATYPERCVSLVLYGACARWLEAADYPEGPAGGARRRLRPALDRRLGLRRVAVGARADARRRRRLSPLVGAVRAPLGAPRDGASPIIETINALDIRAVLPAIKVPDADHAPPRRPADRRRPTGATSPDRSRAPATWSCRARTTSGSPATPTRCSTRSRSSSPARAARTTPIGCWRR